MAFTDARIRTLETLLARRDVEVLDEQRARGAAVQRADKLEAKLRRLSRMLDESRPGWREEMQREITGGDRAQWDAQMGAA